MTLGKYVEGRIQGLFIEIAEEIGQGAVELDEETAAGVPTMLFRAQGAMVAAWRQFCEEGKAGAGGQGEGDPGIGG